MHHSWRIMMIENITNLLWTVRLDCCNISYLFSYFGFIVKTESSLSFHPQEAENRLLLGKQNQSNAYNLIKSLSLSLSSTLIYIFSWLLTKTCIRSPKIVGVGSHSTTIISNRKSCFMGDSELNKLRPQSHSHFSKLFDVASRASLIITIKL